MKILEVVGLTCRVGGVTMLDALSFTLEEGEILALCGPTRAGKTACIRCLSGALPVESGRLILDGLEVTGAMPRDLVRHGLVRVGQIPTPPWSLTVAQAVTLALRWPQLGVLAALLATWPGARGPQVAALLDEVGLGADAGRRRDALPAAGHGRLALAQALALAPRLLLVDEPLGHLPLEDRPVMAALLSRIRASGITLVLTERDPAVAEAVADRVAILDHGAVVA